MTKSVCSLLVRDIELAVHLGWKDDEQSQKQTVLLDIDIQFPQPPKACVSDDLQDTVCYFSLIEEIRNKITIKTFRLIEHLSCEIYRLIKPQLPDKSKLIIRVTKRPKIEGFSGTSQFSYGDNC